MKFKSYPKIHRLGKEETDGLLDTPVTIQEKIDGANVSMWLDGDTVKCGTRTRELPLDESFNGFQEAVRANDAITAFLVAHPTLRLYGEWLVKHTITYPDAAYRKIYLYDVYDEETDLFSTQYTVWEIARQLGLEYPKQFVSEPTILTYDEINAFVGKTLVDGAANGEGVVVKNENFINGFGDHVYAKVVHERFKEANAIVFGGNNKTSESYWEMYVVNKYCTLGRVQKIMQKLQAITDHRLDMKETSQVAGSAYHDMMLEEIWDIQKKVPKLDFGRLKHFCMKKNIQIYHDVLNNSISIADKETEI